MKNWILILFLFGAAAVQAQQKQSLKDLLYSGKLKKDSTGVIRSTDDLSAKIDTSTKKADTVKIKVQVATANQDNKAITPKADINANVTPTVVDTKDSTVAAAPVVSKTSPKTNTKLWKEYIDTLMKTLKAEVLNSKQIKKNTYFLMVDYEIAADGQVTVTNVSSTPGNAFLQAQVKQIMDSTPLNLNPITDSSNQLKKVKRKQQISITKE